jgi:hypothetical protein
MLVSGYNELLLQGIQVIAGPGCVLIDENQFMLKHSQIDGKKIFPQFYNLRLMNG